MAPFSKSTVSLGISIISRQPIIDDIKRDDLFLNKKWLLKISFNNFLSSLFKIGFIIFDWSIYLSRKVPDDLISDLFVFMLIFILFILVVIGGPWIFSLLIVFLSFSIWLLFDEDLFSIFFLIFGL